MSASIRNVFIAVQQEVGLEDLKCKFHQKLAGAKLLGQKWFLWRGSDKFWGKTCVMASPTQWCQALKPSLAQAGPILSLTACSGRSDYISIVVNPYPQPILEKATAPTGTTLRWPHDVTRGLPMVSNSTVSDAGCKTCKGNTTYLKDGAEYWS